MKIRNITLSNVCNNQQTMETKQWGLIVYMGILINMLLKVNNNHYSTPSSPPSSSSTGSTNGPTRQPWDNSTLTSWEASAKSYRDDSSSYYKFPIVEWYYPLVAELDWAIHEELDEGYKGKEAVKEGAIYYWNVRGKPSEKTIVTSFIQSTIHLLEDMFINGKLTWMFH